MIKYWLYGLAAALVLALGIEVNHVLVENAAAVATAKQTETQTKAQMQNLQEIVKTETARRIAAENSIKVVTKRVVVREQATQKQTAELVVPKSVQDVQNDSAKILGVKPDITPDGKLAYAPSDVQKILVVKVEHDQLAQDKQDLQKAFNDALTKASSLDTQLAATQSALTAEKQETEKWKSAAETSKPKKVLDGVKHGAEIVGVAVVSYELGKHLK